MASVTMTSVTKRNFFPPSAALVEVAKEEEELSVEFQPPVSLVVKLLVMMEKEEFEEVIGVMVCTVDGGSDVAVMEFMFMQRFF